MWDGGSAETEDQDKDRGHIVRTLKHCAEFAFHQAGDWKPWNFKWSSGEVRAWFLKAYPGGSREHGSESENQEQGGPLRVLWVERRGPEVALRWWRRGRLRRVPEAGLVGRGLSVGDWEEEDGSEMTPRPGSCGFQTVAPQTQVRCQLALSLGKLGLNIPVRIRVKAGSNHAWSPSGTALSAWQTPSHSHPFTRCCCYHCLPEKPERSRWQVQAELKFEHGVSALGHHTRTLSAAQPGLRVRSSDERQELRHSSVTEPEMVTTIAGVHEIHSQASQLVLSEHLPTYQVLSWTSWRPRDMTQYLPS